VVDWDRTSDLVNGRLWDSNRHDRIVPFRNLSHSTERPSSKWGRDGYSHVTVLRMFLALGPTTKY